MALGQISLNISFILYLIFLWPQIIYNWKNKELHNLSLGFHFVLLFSYLADLLFAFSQNMPWQYKTVSSIGLICLFIQHFQLRNYYKFNFKLAQLFDFMTVFISLILLSGFVYFYQKPLIPKFLPSILGFIANIGFVFYLIPQIIKNRLINQAEGKSLSLVFLILSFSINILDLISAISLSWPLASKLGCLAGILIKIILIIQYFKAFINDQKVL